MGTRRLPLLRTSMVAAGAAAGGAMLYRRHRRRCVVVTLYSEPHYRGVRQGFVYDQRAYALSATKLPQVGSVRVEQVDRTYRRGPDTLRSFLYTAVSGDRQARQEAAFWLPLALVKLTDPDTWRREHDPAGSRASWVRLWAERPASPPPALDGAAAPGEEPYHDVLMTTPDIGEWSRRVRYIEAGIRNPFRADLTPPGWENGLPLPLQIVE